MKGVRKPLREEMVLRGRIERENIWEKKAGEYGLNFEEMKIIYSSLTSRLGYLTGQVIHIYHHIK